MIAFLITLLFLLVILNMILLFFLHSRVENVIKKALQLDKDTSVLNDNQQVLVKDFKVLFHEFKKINNGKTTPKTQ